LTKTVTKILTKTVTKAEPFRPVSKSGLNAFPEHDSVVNLNSKDERHFTSPQTKLRNLSALMLRWAEKDKTITQHALRKRAYEVPARWKKAFKYVTGLSLKLDDGWNTALTKEEMGMCNKYYRDYQ